MLWIDGRGYNVEVVKIKRKGEFLDKYAQRTEMGVLERELHGNYINYQLKLGPNTDPAEYDLLWEKLNAEEEFHTVQVPYGENGMYTFEAYFSNVSDELVCQRGGRNTWNNLTVNFTSRRPRKGAA